MLRSPARTARQTLTGIRAPFSSCCISAIAGIADAPFTGVAVSMEPALAAATALLRLQGLMRRAVALPSADAVSLGRCSCGSQLRRRSYLDVLIYRTEICESRRRVWGAVYNVLWSRGHSPSPSLLYLPGARSAADTRGVAFG